MAARRASVAAACAARHGARTLLIERYGFLGGMGTAGGVTNFAGLYGKRDGETVQLVHGVVDELLERIERLGGLNAPQDGLQGRIRVRSYDIPAYKCAADQLLLAAGVRLLLHALLVGARARRGWSSCRPRSSRPSRAVVRSAHAGSSTRRGMPTSRTMPACPTSSATVTATRSIRRRCSASARVDAERALAAVGSFGAIDALMRAAADRYQFPREGAILRPQRNRSEWRVNVTQVANSQGRAVDATDAGNSAPVRSKGGAR